MTISTMAPFKSEGEDGIYPILLQKGLDQLRNPLCSIYRASLALGYIPNIWKLSNPELYFFPNRGKQTVLQHSLLHQSVSLPSH